jgi:hypothetical protein
MTEEAIYSKIDFEKAFEMQFPREVGIPPFHLLLGKDAESGIYVGLCLDLGNYAHSENEDPRIAYSEIIYSLLEGGTSYIFSLQGKNLLDNLYDNKVRDHLLWDKFSNLNDKKKIRSLVRAFDQRLNTSLEKNSAQQLVWDIEDDFPSLDKIGKDQLIHWLEQLSKSAPEAARIILAKMLHSIFDPANIKEVTEKTA